MRYTLEQRIFMYEEYIKHKSFVECCVRFIQKYPGVRLPRKSVVRKLVTKFRKTGSLLDETEEVDKRQKKSLAQNKLQTSHKSLRPDSGQHRRSGGPVTRAITRDIRVSGGDTPLSLVEARQESDPFPFVGIKCEAANDIIDLESDSDSDMQEPSVEPQMISVKEEPPDTSSCESSDSDFKEEDEGETGAMEGESGSDSDVKEHSDESRLICVKEEPPDATDSASSDDEVGQERLTCVTVKQEVPDDTYVNGVQSDIDATEQRHSDSLQVPTAASSNLILESRAAWEQVMFTSVRVKCELKDEIEAKESPR